MDNSQTNNISKEEEVLAEEVGDLVFQSALLQFIATLDEEASKKFEDFMASIADKEDFMELLLTNYPDFGEVLISEAETLEREVKEVTPE